MKKILALLLFLFTNYLFAQNVIIVVIDGARYSETFGGGDTYIPHLYTDLRPSGYLYTNFKIADEGKTETNPGHTSILTGTWQQIANDGSERPTYPTIFEYIRKEDENPQSDCYAVTGKVKLDILTYSVFSGYGSAYGGTWVGDDSRDDALTYLKVISVMQNYQPKILIINFAEVDVAGHSNVWEDYVAAITNVDNLIFQLWQHIQAGDYGYTVSNTTMFVTNDHGRHTTDFTGHGDDCDGCQHIMLLAIGRNVTAGVENSDLHHQIDIAPTVGDLLGFSTPQAVGVSLFQGSNPLPVELTYFTAKVLVSGGVTLDWRTESEVSNFGFEIERVSFSTTPVQGWEKLGFVQGNGNSNSPKDYSFIDDVVREGKPSYRLKQIDTDGKFKYTKVIEVDLDLPTKFELSQNYPNPFNPATTIRFSLPESGNVSLKVFNTIGQQVAELINGFKEAGIYTINFNASELNSGVYFYRLETEDKTELKKMIFVK